MDRELRENPESTSHRNPEDPASAALGAFFSGSQHFAVAGGTFTSITNIQTAAPPMPPCGSSIFHNADFRMIPLGDICLQDEIRLEGGTRAIGHLRDRGSVRRVYSARVVGLEGNMTVAMYAGASAEEDWWEDIKRCSRLRHPYFIQLCGFTTSPTMHATVFYDDLIPFRHFLELYRYSPILTVYIWGYCATEFKDAQTYFQSVVQESLTARKCTFWIRRSTGRLCADLVPSTDIRTYMYMYSDLDVMTHPQGITYLNAPDREGTVINSLTVEQFHSICYWNLSRRRTITVSTNETATLGAVLACSSNKQLDVSAEIAFLPDVGIYRPCWCGAEGEVMNDGWLRFKSGAISGSTLLLNMWYPSLLPHSWISQANHIFNRLGIRSNFNEYVVVEEISFQIRISATTDDRPRGYLFICPAKDLRAGPTSFRWPHCPAYWSFDPSGQDRLSTEDATRVGFPALQLITEVWAWSWDASVYTGLRQFHKAKGFDPDSQDVARHLEQPLYRISPEANLPLMHMRVDTEKSCSEEDDPIGASDLHHDILPLSETFKLIMKIQLTFMVFSSLFWVYEYA